MMSHEKQRQASTPVAVAKDNLAQTGTNFTWTDRFPEFNLTFECYQSCNVF